MWSHPNIYLYYLQFWTHFIRNFFSVVLSTITTECWKLVSEEGYNVVPWQNLFWNLFKAVIQWKQGNDNFQAINLTKLLRLLIKPVSFTKFEFLVLFCQKGDFNLTCSMDPNNSNFLKTNEKLATSNTFLIIDVLCFIAHVVLILESLNMIITLN